LPKKVLLGTKLTNFKLKDRVKKKRNKQSQTKY
jgi:hypothetical protein